MNITKEMINISILPQKGQFVQNNVEYQLYGQNQPHNNGYFVTKCVKDDNFLITRKIQLQNLRVFGVIFLV